MKKFITLAIFIITCIKFNGQAIERNNALSFEIGKTGLVYSIAFDRKLKNNFGLRVTIGTNFSSYIRAFSTFGGAFFLVGKEKNHLELGADVGYLSVTQLSGPQRNRAFIFPDYPIKTYYMNLNIGYRKYWNKSMFRIGAAPGYSKSGPLPGAYLSYGLTF